MKKLLSVVFMALCGITAIHAQDQDPAAVTPTLQGQRDNVACGTTVTMQATPKPNYHFSKWVKQDANGTEDIDVNTSNPSYNCTTDAAGVNTLSVTLTGGMIDAAQNKILTFTAYFVENDKFTIGAMVVDETGTPGAWGTVSGTGSGYTGDVITLVPSSENNPCYEFDHWETSNGVPVDPANMQGLVLEGNNLKVTVGTADATYKAVFKQKKVTIKVMTADQDKGTVSIISPSAN